MWPFRKQVSLKDSDIFRGFTDWHCHLLPGVDDGVQTMQESLQVLSLYEELGISEVWLTPHIMEDIPNRTEDLKERFMELNAAYQGNIILHLAAENMLDNLFEERLAKNDLLPLGNEGKHLLVETSYFNPPMGLNNILLRIKSKGYVPVLAHPERYVYMDAGDYRQLKEMNVMFQLNLSSIVGGYGTEVKKKAEWLLKNGAFNFWEQYVPDQVNRFFPAELVSVVAAQMGGLVQSSAVAANLRAEGLIDNAQILLAMLVGSAVGNPFRTLRRNLPSALGIFPVPVAFAIVIGMQLSRFVVTLVAIAGVIAFMHYVLY